MVFFCKQFLVWLGNLGIDFKMMIPQHISSLEKGKACLEPRAFNNGVRVSAVVSTKPPTSTIGLALSEPAAVICLTDKNLIVCKGIVRMEILRIRVLSMK
jgi:hypothetical protein